MKTVFLVLIVVFSPFISSAQIIHHISFGDYKLIESPIDDEYMQIEMNGLYNYARMEGEPMLPCYALRLSVPLGSEIKSIEILNPQIETISLLKKILPYQGETTISKTIEKKIIEPVPDVYQIEKYFPDSLVRSCRYGYFDYDNQIFTLNISPFQYNAVLNRLMFYNSFDIKLTTIPKSGLKSQSVQIKRRSIEKQKEYNRLLTLLVENPNDIEVKRVEELPVAKTSASIPKELSYEYVIVTSTELVPYFQKFVAWKRRKGINIGIVTMDYIRANYTGDHISRFYDDAGKLREFLADAYQNGLTYALLGGSKDHVPYRIGNEWDNVYSDEYNPPTDLYFADFNGNWDVDGDKLYGEPNGDAPDYMAEIFVGRVLCETPEHVKNWTEKAILYETNPGNGNYAYLKKAFYTQADQMQSRTWESSWAYKLMNKFQMFTTNKVFEEMSNGVRNYSSSDIPEFPTGIDVVNEMNKNYGFISLMGHGSPCGVKVASPGINRSGGYNVYASNAFHPDYIDSLGAGFLENMTNYNYPNINYSISCDNAAFDDNQEWHRGHSDNVVKRFTVTSKAGSVAFLGNTRSGWIDSSLDLFLIFGDLMNGGTYNLGVAEAMSLAMVQSDLVKYTHNLFSCPEMEMWTDIPQQIPVTVTETGNDLRVNTGNVPDCKICVMSAHDNGESFHIVVTGKQAVISNVPKPYMVTVTKHNYIPYLFPNDIYIQNKSYGAGSYYVEGNKIIAGANVTPTQPTGNVIIQNSAKVTFDSENDILLEGGFEVELGGEFTGE